MNNGNKRTMVNYNNNGISQYGNSWGRTLFCLHLGTFDKLSYNRIEVYASVVWGNVGSCSRSGSRSGDGIVRLHSGDEKLDYYNILILDLLLDFG